MSADTSGSPEVATFSPARLRAWRHIRDVTHATLAEVAGTTSTHVADCEAGRQVPDAATVAAWATVFGCTPTALCSTTSRDPGEYWAAATAAMPPMTDTEIAAVAVILRRIDRRR